MRFFRNILIGMAVSLFLSGAVNGIERFPPPDFVETDHVIPSPTTPGPRQDAYEYIDAVVLLAALGLASYLVLKKRSRSAILALTIFSLLYFGFWRVGCVCAVGSPQNIALSIFSTDYVVPITVVTFFLLPLVFTLFFGRTFCAAVCPLGAVQDLVLQYPVKVPTWLESGLRLFAYIYLGAAILFAATGSAFIICRYDPFISIFRLSGNLNILILGGCLLLIGVFVGRPYCRFICPYGVILRNLSRLSKWRVTITPDECIHCRLCEDSCPFEAIRKPTAQWPVQEYLVAKKRLVFLLLLLPVLVFLGGWAGSSLKGVTSQAHETVRLAKQIYLEEAGQIEEVTDGSTAFRATGQKIEELYLTGLRLEQIHNPRVDPYAYYEEALRRDPGDSRTNTILGIHYNKRGMFEQAEQKLRKAIERISAEYTRPGNAEAYYHLGLTLKAQGRFDEAYDAFYRATWDYAFHSAAYYQLAELSCRKGDFTSALGQIDRSLSTNVLNTKALNVKAAILRKLGRAKQAKQIASEVIATDPLDFLAMNELYLAETVLGLRRKARKALNGLETKMRGEVESYLELAIDYGHCALWDEAIEVLMRPVDKAMDFAGTYPMVYYYIAYFHQQKGDDAAASKYFSRASKMPPDYCFPFRLESIKVLNSAIEHNRSDARAYYYLGNLLYELQPEEAIKMWEKSRQIDDSFAIAHRNLGWAYLRTDRDISKAIDSYEKAVACNSQDPRLYVELDSLYEIGNVALNKRLALLENNHETVITRNDSFGREIMVLVLAQRYDEAIDFLANNHFHVREGGGEIHDVYVDAHLLRGLRHLKNDQLNEALADFHAASEYPENLSVGRPKNDRRASQVAYYIGVACEALGDAEKAAGFYEKAAGQKGTTGWPETRFYQGLCFNRLGKRSAAESIFDELIRAGEQKLSEKGAVDFFAKFGEGQTEEARKASAHYTLGLGHLGKGRGDMARAEFEKAVELNVSHVWARAQLAELTHK